MSNINKFDYVKNADTDVSLPSRSTSHSAGYDFHSPKAFKLMPHETILLNSGVKCQVKDGEFLMILPRSSLGFKANNHIVLTNTVGVIDADYYNNPNNEGEICIKLYNMSTYTFEVNKNDRLVQGVFVKYDTTCDDACETKRNVGLS